MAVESQTDFSGGLNTRAPAHLIGADQLSHLRANINSCIRLIQASYNSIESLNI